MMVTDPTMANGSMQAGGYGPPGGGYPPGGGGGGYGGPPGGGAPPGGGGYGGPPGGGGYGGPPGGAPPGGFGGPPQGGPPGGGYGGPPPGGFGGPPQGGGFGPPGGGFGPPGGPMMPGAGGDVNTTLPLILSIVELVFCCNLIFGTIGIVFAIQAGNAKKAGDLETARSKAKLTYIILAVGLGLEIVGGIIQAIVQNA